MYLLIINFYNNYTTLDHIKRYILILCLHWVKRKKKKENEKEKTIKTADTWRFVVKQIMFVTKNVKRVGNLILKLPMMFNIAVCTPRQPASYREWWIQDSNNLSQTCCNHFNWLQIETLCRCNSNHKLQSWSSHGKRLKNHFCVVWNKG